MIIIGKSRAVLDDLRYCRNVALARHDSLSPFLTPLLPFSPLFFFSSFPVLPRQ